MENDVLKAALTLLDIAVNAQATKRRLQQLIDQERATEAASEALAKERDAFELGSADRDADLNRRERAVADKERAAGARELDVQRKEADLHLALVSFEESKRSLAEDREHFKRNFAAVMGAPAA
jgi:hypothetical protein